MHDVVVVVTTIVVVAATVVIAVVENRVLVDVVVPVLFYRLWTG